MYLTYYFVKGKSERLVKTMDSSISTTKPLTEFGSFEDLRSTVGEEELAELFGNGLKIDKKVATVG
jgi:hypothetical protein